MRRMSLVQLRRSNAEAARDLHAFLPMTREEMDARGWDELDVLIVNGDAYVDHPAFGGALIGRFLQGRGLGGMRKAHWSLSTWCEWWSLASRSYVHATRRRKQMLLRFGMLSRC